MGTNYYAKKPRCPCCGHQDEPIHIGKSSAGWCFALHVHEELGLTTLDAWKTFLDGLIIENEHGRQVSLDCLLSVITVRNWDSSALSAEGYELNNAQPGPNNLMRRRISEHCVGHGEGTWDYITGDFS